MAIAEPPASARSLTRRTALDTARVLYLYLVNRALEIEDADRAYIADTARHWEDRLRELMLRSDATVSDETGEAFAYLARVVTSPQLDDDAVLTWVDAYPEAVANLFPPSQSTFRVLEGWVVARDERRQPQRAVQVA